MEHTMLVWAQSVKQLCSKSMEPIIEEFDLTMIEIGIILFLAESPACDTCRDIADNLLLAKSNVSTAVEHLVQKGLVGRKPGPGRPAQSTPLPPPLCPRFGAEGTERP